MNLSDSPFLKRSATTWTSLVFFLGVLFVDRDLERDLDLDFFLEGFLLFAAFGILWLLSFNF